jgi:hypothetical protein
MKNKLIVSAILIAGLAQAAVIEERTWVVNYPNIAPPLLGTEVDGDGAGWWVEVSNVTDHVTVIASVDYLPFGYSSFDGGYMLGDAVYLQIPVLTTEGDSFQISLWNNANKGLATMVVMSQVYTTSDIVDGIPGIGDLDVTVSWSGSVWQAVPEPATMGLFGLGAIGTFLIRRKKRTA